MPQHSPQLQSALFCAAHGLPVHYLPARKKSPPQKNWQAIATTSPEQIRRWWGSTPTLNPAIAVPPGRVILDSDGEQGTQALADLSARLGPLPETWTVATGSGGSHLYFAVPPDADLSQSPLAPGLDVRAPGKGYVVAPGAIHPNGQPYEWEVSPEDQPIAELPVKWLDRIVIVAKLPEPAPTPSPASPNTAHLLDAAIRRVKAGDPRNQTGLWLATQLRDAGHTQPQTSAQLSAFQKAVTNLRPHPYTPDEARATAQSAYTRPPRAPGPSTAPQPDLESAPASKTPPDLGIVDIPTVLAARKPPDYNILANGLLTRGNLCVIAGAPGVGKSRFVWQLAQHIALGRPEFCGLEIHRAARLVYLQTENSIYRLRDDLHKWHATLTVPEQARLRDFLHVLAPTQPEHFQVGINTERGKLLITETCRRYQPQILLIDPWNNFAALKNENDNAEVLAAVLTLQHLVRRVSPETAIIVVHHARGGRAGAASAAGWDADQFLRGAKALVGSARSVINIAPASEDNDGSIVVNVGKSNDAPRPDMRAAVFDELGVYHLDPEFDSGEWKAAVNGKRQTEAATAPLTVARIARTVAQSAGTITYAETKALKEAIMAETGVKTRAAYNAINRADRAGTIRKSATGGSVEIID